MKKIEVMLERAMFNARWLLAPIYFGLILSIGLLLIKFFRELLHLVPLVFKLGGTETVVSILSLIDIALVANLLLIIIFAGYENFVSRIDIGNHPDKPNWMGKVEFTDLKIKLIGSIVAISGIDVLRMFVRVNELTEHELYWKLLIHITLVISGVLFALMDKLGRKEEEEC